MGSISADANKTLQSSNSNEYTVPETVFGDSRRFRVICVGAGITGLNLIYQVRKHLKNVDLEVYEKNASVGGTWFENTYPGVACDIPSHIYQFLWALNPRWSEFYATGPEIQEYLESVALSFDLESNIKKSHLVTEARWAESEGIWHITIQNRVSGEIIEDWCHFLVNGAGFLNHWEWPNIVGLRSFEGQLLHSAQWDQRANLQDKRVAIIGNGSSGIQLVTALQPVASRLTTLVRNPTWISTSYAQKYAGPDGANFKYDEAQLSDFNDPEKFLAYRKGIESEMNGGFAFSIANSPEQKMAREHITKMMKRRMGEDHPLSDQMIPDFAFGCRRPTPGSGYLEALTQPNVDVVFDPIEEVTPQGIKLKTGRVIEVDVIVCATGFITSWVPRFPIIGRDNVSLQEQWSKRPISYLSFAVANFPNYFVFNGPNAPLNHGSAIPTIEHLTKYLIRLLHKMQTQNYKSVEPTSEAVSDFIQHADAFMERTVWAGDCRAWYKGATGTGVPLTHPGSRLHWFHMLLEPRWEDFKWKRTSSNRFAYLGNGYSIMDQEGKDKAWYMEDADRGYETVFH